MSDKPTRFFGEDREQIDETLLEALSSALAIGTPEDLEGDDVPAIGEPIVSQGIDGFIPLQKWVVRYYEPDQFDPDYIHFHDEVADSPEGNVRFRLWSVELAQQTIPPTYWTAALPWEVSRPWQSWTNAVVAYVNEWESIFHEIAVWIEAHKGQIDSETNVAVNAAIAQARAAMELAIQTFRDGTTKWKAKGGRKKKKGRR